MLIIYLYFRKMSIDDDLIEASPPSAPQNLEISDVEATAVILKWKEPSKDGGAPIKDYQIEFKGPEDEEWQEGPKVKPKKYFNETVNELTTGLKYQFRVSFSYFCVIDNTQHRRMQEKMRSVLRTKLLNLNFKL